MKDKSTNELLEILHKSDEQKLITHVWKYNKTLPLSELLLKFIQEKKLTKSYIIEQSGLHRTYAYQILQGKRRPSRNKLLTFCIAMNLTYAECQQALQAAGHGALYARSRQDAIVIYALQNKLTVVATNTLLYECGEPTLD